MEKRCLQLLMAILFCFTSSVFAKPSTKDPHGAPKPAQVATTWQQPAETKALYYQTFNLANWRLEEILRTYNLNKLPAIIVAIDNTILDNSPLMAKQCVEKRALEQGLASWIQSGKAQPIPGALKFLNRANAHSIHIFYVTDRPLSEKEATLENLKKYGFPQLKDGHLFFKTNDQSKESRRQTISATYEIIMLIGTKLSDLAGNFENASVKMNIQEVDKMQTNFGKNLILLPSPPCGDWDAALANYKTNLANRAKAGKSA